MASDTKIKYADVKIMVTISFMDDGEMDLKSQAMNAALDLDIGFDADMEIVGEIRDTEFPQKG